MKEHISHISYILSIKIDDNELQQENIDPILVTFSVLELNKSNDNNELQS